MRGGCHPRQRWLDVKVACEGQQVGVEGDGRVLVESRAGVHDDLMRVPGKPLGFLAASTIEYHPARPEAHRSTVLAGQKLHSSRPPKPRELPVKMSLRHK